MRVWQICAGVVLMAGVSSGAVYNMDIGGLGSDAVDVANGVPAAPAGFVKVGGWANGSRYDLDPPNPAVLGDGVTAGFVGSPTLSGTSDTSGLSLSEPANTLVQYSANFDNNWTDNQYTGTIEFQVRGLAAGIYDVTLYSWSANAAEWNTIVTWALDWGTGSTTLMTGPAATSGTGNAIGIAQVDIPLGADLVIKPLSRFREEAPDFALREVPLSGMVIAIVPEPATLSLWALGALLVRRPRRASLNPI